MRRIFLLLALVLSVSCAAVGQQMLGGISGMITDVNGARVGKAIIKIHNVATNLDVTSESQSDGNYSVPDLPIGIYTVTFSKEGFESVVHTEVIVQANRTATVSSELKVGAASVTVQVTATPLLNETDTTHGFVLSSDVIKNLPLGTGSFTQLAILSPGINADLLTGSGVNAGLGNQSIWANGQRDSSNSFSINGVSANNLFNGKSSSQVAESRFTLNTGQHSAGAGETQTNTSVFDAVGQSQPTPATETIEELRVDAAMYDASQGANSGAHIALITKSGTNNYHGQLYEYYQTGGWNAAPWFRNNNTSIDAAHKTPALHNSRFGATFGGPILHNKLFFFTSYQGTRVSDELGGTSNVTVPLHLSDTNRSAAGLAAVALQDLGLVVDPTKIDPAALKLMNFKLPNGQFLIPSSQGLQSNGNDVTQLTTNSTFQADQFNANVDYDFSKWDRTAVKYFYSNNPSTSPFAISPLIGFPQSNVAGSQAASINNSVSISPSITWIQTLGFTRQNSFASTAQPLGPNDVGINLFGSPQFPSVSISLSDGTLKKGLSFGPGSNFSNAGFFQNNFQFNTDFSVSHHAHTIRAGASISHSQLNIRNLNDQVASLSFANFASFLLGQVQSRSTLFNGDTNRYYRANSVGLYVQDTYKLRQNLTFDLGLRWDWEGPFTEKNGLLVNFYPNQYKYDPATDTILNSGIVIAGNNAVLGTPGVNNSLQLGRQWGFGPRFGIAWSPSFVKNLVVRTGFGMYYDRGEFFTEFSPSAGSGFNGPFGVTLALPFTSQISATGTSTLSNPFGSAPPPPPSDPAAITKLLPNIAQLKTGARTFLLGAYDANNSLPYVENWSFDLQWQPMNDWLFTLGYVGNHGVHEVLPIPFNQPGIATAQNPLNGQSTSYGFNILPTENIQTFDGGNTDLRVPFLGFSNNSVLYKAEGVSSYNALQVGLQKKFSHGLMITAGYTWSHALDEQSDLGLFFNGNDPLNPKSSYASSSFDRTHVLVVGYVWQTPNIIHSSSFAGKMINGWQFAGVTVAESGQPYDIIDFSGAVAGQSYSNFVEILDPVLGLAPGVTTQQVQLQGTTGVNPLLPVINVNQLAAPAGFASGTNGVPACVVVGGATKCDNFETGFSNYGRNTFRGPFQARFDVALKKEFKVNERVSLMYEFDAFNIFNHPSFDAPRNSASQLVVSNFSASNPACVAGALQCVTLSPLTQTTGGVGNITGTIGSPRILQMSLHLGF
jgi:Carboxypeptidase regulatory-like domain